MREIKESRERRSWAVILQDSGDGRLEARLKKRKDGTWRTMARHVTGTYGQE